LTGGCSSPIGLDSASNLVLPPTLPALPSRPQDSAPSERHFGYSAGMRFKPELRRAACAGPVPRRTFLKVGLGGFGGLTLPGLFRLRAEMPAEARPDRSSAVILVWLRGGASHLDTYDPKRDAPNEYRGPFSSVPTNVPGLHVSELLPRHAKIAHRFTLLRSMAHTGGGHPAGSLQLLSGDPDPQDKLVPVRPDFMSVANYLRADPRRAMPYYVGVNPISRYDNFTIAGPGYLGSAYEPFGVSGDPNSPTFDVPNIGLRGAEQSARFAMRRSLRARIDQLRRGLDHPAMAALDSFERQAMSLLTSPEVAAAFDLSHEDSRVRDRYGRNAWGQQCLMARRLVEAGVEIVTTTFDGPLCGRVANWDDHAVNHNVFEALRFRAPYFDQAVTALIEDIYCRGLDRQVLVVVTGEFGRTPRISYSNSTGGGVGSAEAGVRQPGRDHWPNANTLLFAGGGIATGGSIGATDRRGEEVVEGRVGPGDFLATIYRHLGIDAERVSIPDFSGRPIPILNEGRPIEDLLPRSGA
jgi:uncharacterized protein (DUF1501 family)